MGLLRDAARALGLGLLATASIVMLALIALIAVHGPDDGVTTGPFGAVSFEAATGADGTTTATAGIADLGPILVLLVLATVASALATLVHRAFRGRRAA